MMLCGDTRPQGVNMIGFICLCGALVIINITSSQLFAPKNVESDCSDINCSLKKKKKKKDGMACLPDGTRPLPEPVLISH